jgi:hypothetical protein
MGMIGWRALSRALAVLTLLAGLLAMHGLATEHHAPRHASSTHDRDAALAAGQTAVVAVHHAAEGFASALVTASERLRELSAADCGSVCPAPSPTTALCLAVLSGFALVLHLARTRPRDLPARRRGPTPHTRPTCVVVPRRRDPVAELCISRT